MMGSRSSLLYQAKVIQVEANGIHLARGFEGVQEAASFDPNEELLGAERGQNGTNRADE